MIKLTPTADHTTFNEGEFFSAEYDGRKRTFEFIGEEGDHLISYLIDERTKDGERTDVIEHKPTGHFNA
jgi:hypothetical protein